MDKYELPYAIATSAKDLAQMCNCTENAVYVGVSLAKAGVARSRFVKVEVDMIEIKTRLYQDILLDMTVCDIEGWDKLEYLRELKELIDGFFKQTERSE